MNILIDISRYIDCSVDELFEHPEYIQSITEEPLYTVLERFSDLTQSFIHCLEVNSHP